MAQTQTKNIADNIRNRLKGARVFHGGDTFGTLSSRAVPRRARGRFLAELGLPRYKFMVQVVVGEQRGEGVRMGCRTFWDTDTDAYASDTFINVSGGTHTPACAIALPF